MRHPTSPPAFTLVELLVVVAIIGLLISLVIPALRSTRDVARGAVCASRMRQLAIGWQYYADTNADVSVPGQPGRFDDEAKNLYPLGNGLHYRPRWFALIGAAAGFDAYLIPSSDRADEHRLPVDGADVFLCPTVPNWKSTRNFAYGYNYQFLGNARFADGQGGNQPPRFINFPVRATTLFASDTVLATDSAGTAGGKPTHLRTPNQVNGDRDPTLHALGGHGYALDPPRLATTGSDYADPRNRDDQHRSAPDPRHGGRTNVSFVDGHVESRSLFSLGYDVLADGAVLARGAGATNRWFSGTRADALAPGLARKAIE